MISCQATTFPTNRIGYSFTTLHSNPGIDPHEVNLKTTDGGASWFSIPAHIPAGSFGIIDAYFQNPDIGFVSGDGLARTTDAGITWNIVSGVTGNLTYMSWPDSLHGWVVGGDGKMFRTTDGGGLPVQLASFTGHHLGNALVRLDWSTISEINNYGFYVQRRRENETEFAEISQLIPGHGTTNEPQHYSWTDSAATMNRWYYRLKQVDLDGSVHLTEPIMVDVLTSVTESKPMEYSLHQNYPNPFNPSTTIKYDLPEPVKVSLVVYDVLGRKVTELANGSREAGYHSVRWNGADVSSGVYFARFTATDANGVVKLNKVSKLLLAK
ncbi:MAG: T9SS type A sorting domain-containing protein [bacterium]